ncbi:hypothetical protein [Anaerolinea thermophila]|uniref:hypothetical protein n=1 Tax=Anaerolinea thermophila TaxID=167964 RepID=UPI00155A419E|nr:hypothetical protein [Anaerolinea thermophila]
MFGKPVFKTPLEQEFGWMGLLSVVAGLAIGIVSLVLGLSGWEITRLWLYLLGGALLTLVGVQLVIYWILIRVLGELSQRELLTNKDLNGLFSEE